MKIYGMNWGGTYRVIVATTSWKAAAAIVGMSVDSARTYGSITQNDEELKIATSRPGTAFWKSYRAKTTDPWSDIKPR